MSEAEAIVRFWLHDVGARGWYARDDGLDAEIRSRFGAEWRAARDGQRAFWCNGPNGTLAFLILTDQFPRNMFRDTAEAFATDHLALAAAREAVASKRDLGIDEPQRVFFYMPFEHSEDPADQDIAVRLIEERMPLAGAGYALHARAHREVIRRFGRFPFRNAALGRVSTDAERQFLQGGGYGDVVKALSAPH
jgi:uncharacterized protein (DUF924 family)